MKVARELNVHIGNACKAPIDNADFLWGGISVVTKPQFFFEYRCPRCDHLGRCVIGVHDRCGVPKILYALAEFVSDDPTIEPIGMRSTGAGRERPAAFVIEKDTLSVDSAGC